jgi:hypothetical protein
MSTWQLHSLFFWWESYEAYAALTVLNLCSFWKLLNELRICRSIVGGLLPSCCWGSKQLSEEKVWRLLIRLLGLMDLLWWECHVDRDVLPWYPLSRHFSYKCLKIWHPLVALVRTMMMGLGRYVLPPEWNKVTTAVSASGIPFEIRLAQIDQHDEWSATCVAVELALSHSIAIVWTRAFLLHLFWKFFY